MAVYAARQSTYNDNDVITAAHSNDEFNAILAAFHQSTGHVHDGTAGGGSPIVKIGPSQDIEITASEFKPKTDDTVDLGTSSLEYKDLYIDGLAYIDGLGEDLLVATDKKIQFRDTGLYISSNADGDLDIVSDGTAVDSINIESAGGITLDAGTAGSGIIYEDDGTEMLRVHNSSSDVILETKVSDKDFIVKGNDGGSTITALTIDMSEAGAATFNNKIVATELDISGNVDVDGTLEADAITVNGTALSSYIAGVTVTNATNSAHVYVTDNESTNESNLITFVENGTSSTGNVGLEMDGNLTYNPSTGTVSATGFSGNLTGTLQTAAQTNVTSLGTLTGLTVSGDLFFDNGEDGGKDLLWDVSQDALIYSDNVYASFGSDQDFKVWHDGSNAYIRNTTGTLYIQPKSGENAIICKADDEVLLKFNDSTKFATTNDGVVVTGIMTATTGADYVGLLRESFNTTAGKLSDNTNIDLDQGMIHYFTTQETTTCTPNIRFNSSISLNNKMNTGDAITVNVITTAAAGGYSANWTIDGSAVTEQWVGGSAVSEGGSDGYDIYALNILKTASATFLVIVNKLNAT